MFLAVYKAYTAFLAAYMKGLHELTIKFQIMYFLENKHIPKISTLFFLKLLCLENRHV